MDCQRSADSRLDLFNLKFTGTDICMGVVRFNTGQAAVLMLFLKRTRLGFTRSLTDRALEDGEEVQNWGVGESEALMQYPKV